MPTVLTKNTTLFTGQSAAYTSSWFDISSYDKMIITLSHGAGGGTAKLQISPDASTALMTTVEDSTITLDSGADIIGWNLWQGLSVPYLRIVTTGSAGSLKAVITVKETE